MLEDLLEGILNRLPAFLSRKFLLALLAGAILPQIGGAVDQLGPYLWAGIGLVALYIVVEGTRDIIEALNSWR